MNPVDTIAQPASRAADKGKTGLSALSLPDEKTLLYACAALVVFFNIHLALTRTINWDEFHFFRQIVEFNRGEPLPVFQTLHVELFYWLPDAVSTGVDGIVVGRVFMLLCEFVTAGAIALIAERFVDRRFAIVAALLWLASGFTLHHGWSFRTDPMATAFAMASLAVLTRAPLTFVWALVSGALVGIAGFVTIKAILYLPAFAGIALLRWSDVRYAWPNALRIAAVPAVAVAALGALVFWHAGNLPQTDASSANGFVGATSNSMLFAGWPIYLHFVPRWAILSLPAFAILVITFFAIKGRPLIETLALAGLLAPLAALVIYRNSLPYFYPTMLAPVMAASAIGVAAFAEKYGLQRLLFYTIISGAIVWGFDKPSRMDEQRDIQTAADTIFEEPVGYLDFPGMLPDHRKANTFLSRWGIESYYQRGPGEYRTILENDVVPLLLTAEPEMNPTLLAIMTRLPQEQRFHKEDRETLRATYRQFWGPYWIAGAEVAAGESLSYEVLVPGDYTVTGAGLSVNGEALEPGSVRSFDRGLVELRNAGQSDAGIIWGDNPKTPDMPVPERPYWRGF